MPGYPRHSQNAKAVGGRASCGAARYKWELAYVELRRRIRDQELRPGAILRGDELAQDLGISRTPVRAAIVQLAEDGLVDIVPHSASFVAPVRADELRERVLIRMALEVEAAWRAAACPEQVFLQRLADNIAAQEAAVARDEVAEVRLLSDALHAEILASVAGRWAQRQLEAARVWLERAISRHPGEGTRAETILAGNRVLVEAIASRDPALAAGARRAQLFGESMVLDRAALRLEGQKRDSRARSGSPSFTQMSLDAVRCAGARERGS